MSQQNIAALAANYRNLMIGVAVALAFTAVSIGLALLGVDLGTIGRMGSFVLSLAISIYLLIQVINTTKALGWSTAGTVLSAIAMFIPCVSLVVLIIIIVKAAGALKAAGYTVTFMEAKM